MRENPQCLANRPGPLFYQIRLKRLLDQSWSEHFIGWTIEHEKGEVTVLCGRVLQQASLFEVLDGSRTWG